MRVNYDVDAEALAEIADLTVGEVKELLLRCTAAQARRIGAGLTGVMAAAVAKLMDVHELVLVARKLKRPTTRADAARPARGPVLAPAAQPPDRRPRRRSRCSCTRGCRSARATASSA